MSEIKGYKVLTDEQITQINHLKGKELDLLHFFSGLYKDDSIDKRWLSISRTHIEEAFMAAVRAITQPETVPF